MRPEDLTAEGARARGWWLAVAPVLLALAAICWLSIGVASADAMVRVTPPHSTWHKAQEVPGSAALNTYNDAYVATISCAAAGDCSAGGYYSIGSDEFQAYVVNEVKGTWKKAETVPRIAYLNAHHYSGVESISCASAGNCSAGGYYETVSHGYQAFVVNEVKGRWKKAETVPGSAALNAYGNAEVDSISCTAPGDCSAGGYYETGSDEYQAFVVNEVKGSWKHAEEVPGTNALNSYDDAEVQSISCSQPGYCSAVGYYSNASNDYQAFVANEVKGRWKHAEEVPGSGALNTYNNAGVYSVSCTARGYCAAGGYYATGTHEYQAFVVNETKGKWKKAEIVPGTAALNTYHDGEVESISCTSPGYCSAGGNYAIGSDEYESFVVNEIKGKWKKAQEIPRIGALNTDKYAELLAVSCGSQGYCSADGYYASGNAEEQAFVVNEVKGRWQKAQEMPGTAALNTANYGEAEAISCASASNCSAGGYYYSLSSGYQAFVAQYKPRH